MMGTVRTCPTLSFRISRPGSGDSGYYSRPPPAIVRRSASPPAQADSDQHNPFAHYRTFEQFRSGKHGGSGSGGGNYSKFSSDDFGERRGSGQRQLYSSRKVSNSSTESDSCFGSLTGTAYSDDRADYRSGLFRNQQSNNSSYTASRNQEFSSSSYTTSRANKATSSYSSSRSTSPTKFSLGALK